VAKDTCYHSPALKKDLTLLNLLLKRLLLLSPATVLLIVMIQEILGFRALWEMKLKMPLELLQQIVQGMLSGAMNNSSSFQ
jgi:hypothetical protein